MIAPEAGLSVSRQCALLGIARSSFYYRPRPEAPEELEVAPFQWTVCQLAVCVLVMAACMLAS